MSGLTKKTVFADKVLSTLLGVKEGELVSYAQLSKGLHKYIKDNDLKNLNRKPPSAAAPQPTPSKAEPVQATPAPPAQATPTAAMKKCNDCGADIPAEATFCDLCGVEQ
jgi:hypothetical protein